MFLSFPSLRHAQWRGDLFAGLTLAAIAIPEQMATARLAGFPPHVGFIAFIAGSLAFALLGSSRVVSVGADSTIAPIFAGALGLVAATGSPHYHALASLLALLVGALLIVGSMLRAGAIANLLSVPVLTGFLAGVAIHIALSQAPAFLGLPPGPEAPLPRLLSLVRDIGEANAPTILIGASCLLLIFLTEKLSPRIPGALIALAAAAWATTHFNLTARGVAVLGNIAHALPHLALPAFTVGDLTHIVGLAVIVSLVVMVQTAATSRAFPTQDVAPDVDRDFLGAGAGSILAGLFGAFAVDASPPRTAIVMESGGASQLSGLAAVAIVAATLFYGGASLAQIPTAGLAAVLIFVAGRLLRWRDMLSIFRATRAEFTLVVLTMLAVVLLPIQTGVGLAIILSLLHGDVPDPSRRDGENSGYNRLVARGRSLRRRAHAWSPGRRLSGAALVPQCRSLPARSDRSPRPRRPAHSIRGAGGEQPRRDRLLRGSCAARGNQNVSKSTNRLRRGAA